MTRIDAIAESSADPRGRNGHVRAVVALASVLVALAGCGGGDEVKRVSRPAAPSAKAEPAAATVVARREVAPRILDLTVRSPALGRTGHVRLMTPVGWTPQKQWPVLWLLHGCCDTYKSWTRSTGIEQMKPLRRVLVAMPEGGDVGFYADWKGGPGWETFHTKELPALLQEDFGASDRQAIAGLSMGGLGAMGYAARHPGMYKAAAAFSGLLHPSADKGTLGGLIRSYGGDPATVYPDGWEKHDPTELAAQLKGTRLFVSSGNGHAGPFERDRDKFDSTEAFVEGESRAFADRLKQLKIPAKVDFYGPGVHNWPYWERELKRALPTLLAPS
jgi:diacylglycerol O-acyltransferase / trehalose O-mycolyltransferase